MARKQMIEGGTKNKILEVATTQFFERGFDGTGVRSIMKEVGADIGTFYYYFSSKDALFDEVLIRFFEDFRHRMDLLLEEVSAHPQQSIQRFFDEVRKEVETFKNKYGTKLHFTIQYAYRERILTIMEPYLEAIIRQLVEKGAKPRMEIHTMAVFLCHGVGGIITHEGEAVSITEIRKAVNYCMGLTAEEQEAMFGKSDAEKEYGRRMAFVQGLEGPFKGQVWELLKAADAEFVPALSTRNSTRQEEMSGEGVKDAEGPRAYFEEMSKQNFLLALENGEVKAFASYIPGREMEIDGEKVLADYVSTIVVHPAYRNRGLLKAFYGILFNRGESGRIMTRTWSTNDAHIHVLEEMGFRKIKTIPNDRGADIDTVYFMKTL